MSQENINENSVEETVNIANKINYPVIFAER